MTSLTLPFAGAEVSATYAWPPLIWSLLFSSYKSRPKVPYSFIKVVIRRKPWFPERPCSFFYFSFQCACTHMHTHGREHEHIGESMPHHITEDKVMQLFLSFLLYMGSRSQTLIELERQNHYMPRCMASPITFLIQHLIDF